MKTISLEEGKYELRFDEESGALWAYRYGEPWRDLSGDKFVYLLMVEALRYRYLRENCLVFVPGDRDGPACERVVFSWELPPSYKAEMVQTPGGGWCEKRQPVKGESLDATIDAEMERAP